MCFLTLLRAPVEAKTALTVSPTKLEFGVGTQRATRSTITVTNNGDAPLSIRSYVMGYSRDSSGKIKFLSPGTGAMSCAGWIKTGAKKFALKQGETKQVSCFLNVPDTAAPGQYHAVVFFEAVSDHGPGMAISGRLGTMVLLKIPPARPALRGAPLPWFEVLVTVALLAIFGGIFVRERSSRRLKKESESEEGENSSS